MSVVSSVSLAGFRGAPLPVTIDFTSRTGNATSALLIGDNGMGKSTIVDAIEFCLQAKVGRLAAFNDPALPRIASYGDVAPPTATVTLEDGALLTRTAAIYDDGQIAVQDRSVKEGFRLAPVSIKRSDLLRFAGAARNDRLVQLLDFLSGAKTAEPDTVDEASVGLLEEERRTQKERRRNLTAKLAQRMNVEPDAIPVGQGFDAFISKYGRDKSKGAPAWRVRPQLWPLVRDIRATSRAIKEVEQHIANAQRRTKRRSKKAAQLGPIRDVLASASSTLTTSFLTIASGTFVTAIDLRVAAESEVSLEVRVHLPNGQTCPPARVLSEGKQDLLTLLLFVALAEEAVKLGQKPLLMLDDALQSLSGEVRVRFAEYLLNRLRGWQLIMTVHDRLWAAQLRTIMNRLGIPVVEREIRSWSFERGPVVSARLETLRDATARAVSESSPDLLCAVAARLLEEVADHLSCELRTGVARKRGDRYTLGDTWPGVYKQLRKTSVAPVAEAVERWQPLRNLVGAHFNEWALSLSLQEARAFAEAVLALESSTACGTCGGMRGTGVPGTPLACRCGATSVTKS